MSDYCFQCKTYLRRRPAFCPTCGALLELENRYRILGKIGEGGFSVVYEALDRRLDRRCAIKEPFDLATQETIDAEWQISRDKAQDFPFIADIYDVVRVKSTTYMVMEYIPGPTLDQTVPPPWSPLQVEDLLRTFLGYLARLHSHGLIHRDLKPQNIKRLPEPTAPERRYVLLDFGVAKRDNHRTSLLGKAASLPYSPPEQRDGRPTDERSDLFSLAATAFQVLTGDIPFDIVAYLQETPHELVEQLSSSGASPALERTLARMLQLEPSARPANAQDALALLDEREPPAVVLPPTSDEYSPATGATVPLIAEPLYDPQTMLGRGRATGVAWSPDEQFLVVATALGVYVYNAQSLEELRSIATGEPVRYMSFSPDGRILTVVAGALVHLWRVGDWQRISANTITTPAGSIVALAPDGQVLATTEEQGLQIRRVSDKALLTTISGATDSIIDTVAFGPPGSRLVAIASCAGVELRHMDDGTLLHTLETPAAHATGIAFAPDGQTLAAACGGEVLIWRVSDGVLLHVLSTRAGNARSMVFAPNGQTLAAVTRDRVELWWTHEGTLRRELDAHGARWAAFDPTGRALAVAAAEGVSVRRVRDGALIGALNEHMEQVNSVTFSPDGAVLATIGTVSAIWRVRDRALVHLWETGAPRGNGVAFSPDGHLLATASIEAVELWRAEDWELIHTLEGRADQANGVVFSADGEHLLVAAPDGVELWQVTDGTLQATLCGGTEQAQGFALAPDGQAVAVVGERSVQVWQVGDGSPQAAPMKTAWDITSVALSASGERLAIAWDEGIQVWETGDDEPLCTVHTGAQRVTLAPGGDVLAAVWNTAIRVWRVRDGALLKTLEGHTGSISGAAFAPDGSLLASASQDGTVRLWDLSAVRYTESRL